MLDAIAHSTAQVIDLMIPHNPGMRALLLVIALNADAILGEPDWLWRRLPHPVVFFGKAIAAMTAWGNRPKFSGYGRRWRGIIGIMILVMLTWGIGGGVVISISTLNPVTDGYASMILEVIMVTVLLAGRSLDDHVRRVGKALAVRDIEAARYHVSMIVGRNPEALDEAAMARAAIETTAENLSDGVVAPAFFYLVFGLPGIIAYKMINTADSMIGYRSKRYYAFGTGAARLDDLANIIPARLTALLIALAAPGRMLPAFGAMISDASKHRSPNAGWPEAAMAAVLGLSLAGPRQYGQRMSKDPALYPQGRRDATADDIRAALLVMWRAIALFAVFLLAAGLA